MYNWLKFKDADKTLRIRPTLLLSFNFTISETLQAMFYFPHLTE